MEVYKVNILAATNTKCLRASIYHLSGDKQPVHECYLPMNYSYNSMLSCVAGYLKNKYSNYDSRISQRKLAKDTYILVLDFN